MAGIVRTLLTLFFLLAALRSQAQDPTIEKRTQKQFEGLWENKKNTRRLKISFRQGYAMITDWTDRFQKPESGDIYKAFLKNGKLIMPEETDHRAPYSEIIFKNNRLIYLTKSILPKPGTKKFSQETSKQRHRR